MEVYNVGSGLPSADIFALEQDPSGRLWILCRGGIAIFDGRKFSPHPVPHQRQGSVTASLTLDARGTMWAGTHRAHAFLVSYLDEMGWHDLSPAPPIFPSPYWNVPMAVTAIGAKSRVALGTWGSGLLLWQGDRWTTLGPSDGLPSATIHDLAVLGDTIVVATGGGVCQLAKQGLDCTITRAWPELRGGALALHAEKGQGGGGRVWLLAPTWLGFLENERLTILEKPLGLPLSGKGAIVTDEVGGIWFGDPRELRFRDPLDQRTRPLTKSEGMAGNGVTAFLRDREANLWIGGLRGLSQIRSQRFLSFNEDQGLLEDEVSAIAEPAPGTIAFGHNLGLTLWTENGGQVFPIGPPPQNSPNSYRILDMETDSDGRLVMAAADRGLVYFAEGRILSEPQFPVGMRVYAVEIDTRGQIWVLSPRNLFLQDGADFAPVEIGIELAASVSFRWLTATEEGELYIAMVGGVLHYDGERWHRALGETTEANNVYNVLVDSSKNVWVATRAGLFELRGHGLHKVQNGALEVDRPVYFLTEDRQKRLWIGTDNGVFLWDGHELRNLTVRHGLAGRETNRGAGFVDHLGRVWIGTDRGASLYREIYDVRKKVAPNIEIRSLEVEGQEWPHQEKIHLDHDQNTLSFHIDTVSFQDEEELRYRYRLEGLENEWQGPVSLSSTEFRYINLAPGAYRFRISAGRPRGEWSREALSPWVTIALPFYREPWFVLVSVAAVVFLIRGGHGLRMRAVRAKNVELEAANAERQRLIAELEARNAELERFSYTVSHDLKSPLFTVEGFLGLLKKDIARGDDRQTERDIAEIGRATKKMGQLLDELLELSRVGRVANPPERVDLTELAREVVAVTCAESLERSISITISPDLPAVSGDRIRLAEVLQNLVENAVKYMGDPPAPRIEIGVRHEKAAKVVFVKDNGSGIDPRYHEKVFGLFERLETATDGTGVGLALVKRIIEFHGGKIWVESEGLGRGSTFCFTLKDEESA